MIFEFLLAFASWRFGIRPLLVSPSLQETRSNYSLASIVGFCRPHTVKGTVLACTSGYLLLSIYFSKYEALSTFFLVTLSGVSANIFIVGINQLVDVESDRVNGKDLPIATGHLEWTIARDIVGITWVVSILLSSVQSMFWAAIITSMCLIGVLYSVPPFRLKRFALPAALCIVCARALLGTVGGALTYMDAMGIELDSVTSAHLKWFTGIMTVFTTVIALMKDVPDIEGDLADGVRSLSVMTGPTVVSNICFFLLSLMYTTVVLFHNSTARFTHLAALVWLWGAAQFGLDKNQAKAQAMHNYFSVIWPLFYFEFIAYLLPIVLPPVPSWVPGSLLGLEVGYLLFFKPSEKTECITNDGIDLQSAALNILGQTDSCRDKGPIGKAAQQISLALGMHFKLSRSALLDVRKLGILCGDWLLAKAVLSLCETGSHAVIGEMGRAIAIATAGPEEEVSERVWEHANRAIIEHKKLVTVSENF